MKKIIFVFLSFLIISTLAVLALESQAAGQ